MIEILPKKAGLFNQRARGKVLVIVFEEEMFSAGSNATARVHGVARPRGRLAAWGACAKKKMVGRSWFRFERTHERQLLC